MNRSNSQSRVLFGAIVILFGVLALADNLVLFNTQQVIQFWPVVFMAFGGMRIARHRNLAGLLLGVALMVTGMLMTLSNMGLITFHLYDWWPVFLIIGGIGMIAGGPRWHRGDDVLAPRLSETDGSSSFNALAILSGNKFKVSTQDFRLGDATAFMGGMEIDLRQASIQSDAVLDVFAMWGGIVLRVPTDWAVLCKGTPILGGIDDKTVPPANPTKRLVVDGFVLMGGVEIRN